MTLREIIERIKLEAVHMNPNSRVLDGEIITELVLPRCIDLIVSDCVKNPEELHSLRSDTTLTIVSGVSTDFPQTIRPEFIETIIIPADVKASYIPRYDTYRYATNNFCSVFCYHNSQLHYTPQAASYISYSGPLIINTVVTPTLPAIGSAFVAKDRFVEKLITYAAKVITGQLELKELDYAREVKRVPSR